MALLSVPSNPYALNMQPSHANYSDTADDNSPSCYFVTYHGLLVSLCNKAAKKHCCHMLQVNSLCVTLAAVHAMEKLSGAYLLLMQKGLTGCIALIGTSGGIPHQQCMLVHVM